MQVNSENKSQLVKKALNDKDSFVYLFELYYSEIFTFCAKRIFNRVSAENVCTEVFLRMTAQLSRMGDNLREIRQWLYRTACQHCTNAVKNIPANSANGDITVTTPLNVDLSNAQKLSILKNDVLALNTEHQNIFALRFYANMQPDEIGQVLKIKLPDVRQSLKDITDIFADSRTTLQSEPDYGQVQTGPNEKRISKFVNSIDFDDQVNPQHHEFLLSDIVRQWKKQKEPAVNKKQSNRKMLITAGFLLMIIVLGLIAFSIYFKTRPQKAEKQVVQNTPGPQQPEDKNQQAKRIINEFQILWEMAKQGSYDSMADYLNSDEQLIRDTAATFLANTGNPEALKVLLDHLKNKGIENENDIVYKAAMKLRKNILQAEEKNKKQQNKTQTLTDNEVYSGTVEDFDFNPLPQVKVQSYLLDIDQKQRYLNIIKGGYKPEDTVFTNDQGVFETAGLTRFDPLRYDRLLVFSLPGYTSYSIIVDPDGQQQIEVVLDRGAVVRGTVENEQGFEVDSARVMAADAEQQDITEMIYLNDLTDSTGTFTIKGLSTGTSYDITVLAEKMARYSSSDNEFENPIAAGADDVRIILQPASAVRGHLLLPERTRLQKENIAVALTGDRGTFLGITDSTGLYEIKNVPASTYRLMVDPDDLEEGYRTDPIPLRVEPDAVIEADILLEPASSLLIEVIDIQTGQPVSNYPVSLMGTEDDYSKKARTGPRGYAGFDITPGAYSIIVPTYSQQGLQQYAQSVIVNDLSDDLEVAVEINPVGDVEIQAVNIDQGPVRCIATLDSGLTLQSDNNGIINLPLPGPGEGTIFSALIVSEELDFAELSVLDSDLLIGNDDMMKIGLRPVTEVLLRVAMPDLTPALEPQFAFLKEYQGKAFVMNLRVSPVEISSEQAGYYSIYPVPVDSEIILRCRSANYYQNIKLSDIMPGNVLDLGQVILRQP